MRDGIKLFLKEFNLILKSNYFIYTLIPIFRIILILLLWINFKIFFYYNNNSLSFIIFIRIIILGIYSLLIRGWSSNSLYSIIGAIRRVAQRISYEVTILIIIFYIIFLMSRLNLNIFIEFQLNNKFIFINFIITVILYLILLAELNRTPFDLAEGESELVSGFNTEYIRGVFALIFISEYGIIILLNIFFIVIIVIFKVYNIIFIIIIIIFLILVIWIRGRYPRIRYDKLIILTWLEILPIRLWILISRIVLKFI